jgi:hypothetical protein
MDKSTSIIAALNAGKLPSTQQFNRFIEYLERVGIVSLQERLKEAASGATESVKADAQLQPEVQAGVEDVTQALSAQGKVLADDLQRVLSADRKFLNDKNADNILQEAIWHLAQGTITTTSQAVSAKEGAQQDLEAIRHSLCTLLKAFYHSLSYEGSTLFADFLSLIRLSLSDALEVVEGKAGHVKDELRRMESEVQEGKRDLWGRDKERLEQEKDPKVAWEHGVDSIKVAGTSVIGGAQGAQERLSQEQEKAEGELKGRYYSIWQRAQSDPEYRQALDTLFSILQSRLHAALDTADPTKDNKNITLSTFINDSSAEQHIPKGITLLRTFFERLAGMSLNSVIDSVRNAMAEVLQDERLRVWFDEFFAYTRKTLEDVHYAHSDEAKAKRKDLRERWKKLNSADENPKWHQLVEKVKTEWMAFEKGIKEDADLRAINEAQSKLAEDLKTGLTEQVGGAVEQALEEVTWFWQDLFKVYLPNILAQWKEVPIPRTEYKDDDIEFVLENLDISRLNILPSRVYIRNITDIAIQTFDDPSLPADKQLATLTQIQLQAVQMHLKDLSFWYKDKHATVVPGEFTGLLEMSLPPQGINVDLKVRMIPVKARGKLSRQEQKRFHVVDRCAVEISDDVEISVKESNHAMLVNVFSGLVKRRIKEAMEKTLTGQFRALVDWLDGVAYDVVERRKVFEDAGLGGGPAVIAALWSEVGRLEREAEEGGFTWGIKATGSGIIFEEQTQIPMTTTGGNGRKALEEKFEYEVGKQTRGKVLAVGAEPQVLSGDKRGPLGTGSESIATTVQSVISDQGMDVDVEGVEDVAASQVKGMGELVGGYVAAGKGKIEGFRHAVLKKERAERKTVGQSWRSDAFDF